MFNKRRMLGMTMATLTAVGSISAGVLACTNVIVGKNASVDGSVMTSWTDDSGSDNFKMKIVPAMDWEAGSTRTVLRNTDYDDYYQLSGTAAEYSPGEIPQVEHTYAYLDASYSFMNENGVMIAESTIGGHSGMTNRAGWFEADYRHTLGTNSWEAAQKDKTAGQNCPAPRIHAGCTVEPICRQWRCAVHTGSTQQRGPI